MFSIRKIFSIMTVAFSMLSVACSSHDGGQNAEEKALQQMEEQKKVEEAANPITAQSWCRLDDWETYQVVLRVKASKDTLRMEYIRVTSTEAPVSYPYEKTYSWRENKDANPLPNLFDAELTQNTALIPGLKGFDEQKRIADEILPNNPILKKKDGAFTPPVGLSLKTRDLDTGDVALRNMYPCSSYSPTFNEEFPTRPFMEIILKISKSMDGYVTKGLDHIANAMSLVEPIEEFKVDAAAVENTQWCSWREAEENRVLLKTVSFSGGRFIENSHSQVFTEYPDDASINSYLAANAKRSEFYNMSFVDGRAYGKNTTDPDKKKELSEELFFFVRDGAGTKAMVRTDPRQPENYRQSFTDIYFECSNTRPLQFATVFAPRLAQILDLQMQQLHPAPPAPAPQPQPSPEPQPQPQPAPGPQPAPVPQPTPQP